MLADFVRKPLLIVWLFIAVLGKVFSQSVPNGTTPQGVETTFQHVSPLEIYIQSLCREIEEEGKTTDKLDESSLMSLPIGIARQTPAGTFVIAVDSSHSTDRGWFFSAYASITLPGTTRPLSFAAKNIAYNPSGLSSSSQVRLILAAPVTVSVNDNVSIELPADGHNFLEWDCNGFKSVNLKGNFLFSKDLLIPDTEIAPKEPQVKASFEINTGDLHNILLNVNITPFQIKGLKDLSFEVRNATADFSDIVNPSGFSFPQDYQQSFGENITLWRGFYLNEVSIRIKDLADDKSKDPTISARNLLIDDLGVSGLFSATNLISLQNGSADGWPLSVDQMSVKLMFSKVTGGSLAGNLSIPFLGDEPVPYTAMLEQTGNEMNYRFSVTTTAGKDFPTPFSATIRLEKGSVIALEKKNGKFYPSTKLQGSLKIKAKLVKIDEIKFQDLSLTTEKPYIKGGVFSTVGNGQGKSGGFPIRIDNVKLSIFEGEAAIGFHVALNMMNASDKGFAAETYIRLLAGIKEEQVNPNIEASQQKKKRQKWEFKKIKVEDIILGAGKEGTTAISFKGRLSLYDDHPVYGDGFSGSIALSVKKILEKGIKVNAYFGSKDTYRYWHVDAFVPAKIPLVPPLIITGFMGGASYKMVRQQPFLPDFNNITADNNSSQAEYDAPVYIPDEKVGLSLMAGVTLIAGTDQAVNADAMLEIAFNQGGGIRYAQFTGTAFFFVPTKNRERTSGGKAPKAPVYASLSMLYDNDNDVFHANLKTYINVANVVRGTGPNGLVGEAVIHVDPKDWYVYIGRPSQMFGLDVAKLAVAQAYFMIGTQMENMPPPPPEVLEVFDDIDPNTMRDAGALKGGRGFATGAHFRIGFDSGNKLKPFYIVVTVGAGADIMLRDYGDAHCAGHSGKIGMDGWYASGQAYVFLKGKVGVKVKKREFDIASLGAAALLQAKLPNPTWLSGRLGGKYSILGGLVKGKFNLKFVVGEQCEVINSGNELDDIKVIADIKPDQDASDVNVFSAPQVSFNTSLETKFTMTDNNDKLNSYRVKLDKFTVTKDGVPLQGNIEWNATKDVVILKTFEILPPQTKLKATARIYWEKKSPRGIWETIKENGQTDYEIKEAFFVTGAAPDFIPEENVAFSYPVRQQYNFHVNETGTGYVNLRQGQSYLFEGGQWTYIARFQDMSRKTIDVPLTYNTAQKQATFSIPNELSRQAIYKLFFVKRPVSTGAIDQNLDRSNVTVNTGEGNEATVASNTLEGTLTQSVEKDLYSSVFRTSQFATFEEKWTTFSSAVDVFDVATGYVAVIGKRGNIQETFDELELKGSPGRSDALVQAVASPNTEWMRTLSPLIYDSYPIDQSVTLSWRDPSVVGVKPLKGVKLTNADRTSYKLEDSNVTSGSASSKSGVFTIGYFLSWYGLWDYGDLKNKTAAKYLNNWSSAPPAAKQLLANKGYTDLLAGQYPVEIIYSLPGTNQVTFRREISIKF